MVVGACVVVVGASVVVGARLVVLFVVVCLPAVVVRAPRVVVRPLVVVVRRAMAFVSIFPGRFCTATSIVSTRMSSVPPSALIRMSTSPGHCTRETPTVATTRSTSNLVSCFSMKVQAYYMDDLYLCTVVTT